MQSRLAIDRASKTRLIFRLLPLQQWSHSASAVGFPFQPQQPSLECSPPAGFPRGPSNFGAVAQLGERCVRNAEVGGSTPLRSTEKALFANTAGKAFSLEIMGFE